eukprot:TRINITY_DN26359_c1_g1_i1.p1 TRINITY_DN26359_c1_g1~~TRINITY_DN26359_c1_g1_i1.p1  ORF type:complete len:842 (-),score=110.17 TRINITY_DN26359_c1_g1_i1:694-3219(-)
MRGGLQDVVAKVMLGYISSSHNFSDNTTSFVSKQDNVKIETTSSLSSFIHSEAALIMTHGQSLSYWRWYILVGVVLSGYQLEFLLGEVICWRNTAATFLVLFWCAIHAVTCVTAFDQFHIVVVIGVWLSGNDIIEFSLGCWKHLRVHGPKVPSNKVACFFDFPVAVLMLVTSVALASHHERKYKIPPVPPHFLSTSDYPAFGGFALASTIGIVFASRKLVWTDKSQSWMLKLLKHSAVTGSVVAELLFLMMCIDAETTSGINYSAATYCFPCLLLRLVCQVAIEDFWDDTSGGAMSLAHDVLVEIAIPIVLIYMYHEYPDSYEGILLIIIFSARFLQLVSDNIKLFETAELEYAVASSVLQPIDRRVERVREIISCQRKMWAAQGKSGRIVIAIGNGAVGKLVNMQLKDSFMKRSLCHHLVVIDTVDLPNQSERTLPDGATFLLYNIQSVECFSKVMGQFGLKSGDIVLELAHGISTIELAAWCMQQKLHMVNAHISEFAVYDEIVPLHQQIQRLESWLRDAPKKGPTCLFAHGMNPGLVTYCAKTAILELGKRFDLEGSESEPEVTSPNLLELGADERTKCISIADKLKLCRIDITEIDTQTSSRQDLGSKFAATWSAPAMFEEIARSEAVVAKGHDVECLGAFGLSALAWSISPMPSKAHVFSGYITSHEECYTLQRILPKGSAATVQFVYQPSRQMRESVIRDQDKDELLNEDIHIMGHDVIPGGFDCVGALAVLEGGAAHWCGYSLKVEDSWKACEGSNATSWLTAAGVLLGVQLVLDHPDLGPCLPEDLPNSVCKDLHGLGLPPMTSAAVDETAKLIPDSPPTEITIGAPPSSLAP